MNVTNADIYASLSATLRDNSPVSAIAWPGGPAFTPPSSGYWLEPVYLPNDPIDNGLGEEDSAVPRGHFNIFVYTRPGSGITGVQSTAEQIAGLYPKNASVVGLVRVSSWPVVKEIDVDKDRISCVVFVSYSG